MATRASSKKEPSQKAKPKADLPAEKVTTPPPQPATDLISPSRKKPAGESRTHLRSGVPPISKAKQPVVAAVNPASAVDPVAEPPPPKPAEQAPEAKKPAPERAARKPATEEKDEKKHKPAPPKPASEQASRRTQVAMAPNPLNYGDMNITCR